MNEFLLLIGIIAGLIAIVVLGHKEGERRFQQAKSCKTIDPSLLAIHGEELHEALSDEEATDLLWKDWEEARNLNG